MKWKPPETNSYSMSPEIVSVHGCEIPEDFLVIWNYDREGDVIFWNVHEDAMQKMQQRITYLENCCDEYIRQLTGD